MTSLDVDTITFGKYKNKTLKEMLKDRKYCSWFLKETDFQTKYEYIYNKVKEYEPKIYFFPIEELLVGDNFIDNYIYILPSEVINSNFDFMKLLDDFISWDDNYSLKLEDENYLLIIMKIMKQYNKVGNCNWFGTIEDCIKIFTNVLMNNEDYIIHAADGKSYGIFRENKNFFVKWIYI
jgi:hypothetical protein